MDPDLELILRNHTALLEEERHASTTLVTLLAIGTTIVTAIVAFATLYTLHGRNAPLRWAIALLPLIPLSPLAWGVALEGKLQLYRHLLRATERRFIAAYLQSHPEADPADALPSAPIAHARYVLQRRTPSELPDRSGARGLADFVRRVVRRDERATDEAATLAVEWTGPVVNLVGFIAVVSLALIASNSLVASLILGPFYLMVMLLFVRYVRRSHTEAFRQQLVSDAWACASDGILGSV